jgi:hypothetical protein
VVGLGGVVSGGGGGIPGIVMVGRSVIVMVGKSGAGGFLVGSWG